MAFQSWRRLVAALLPLAAIAGCSSIKVTQDYRPGTDFSTYRTFAVAPAAALEERFGKSPLAPSTQRRIEDALGRELVARGLSPAGAAQADLAVAYRAGRHGTVDSSTYGRTYTYSESGAAQPVPITKDISEGVLLVELLDARTGELVWRGEGKGKPNPNQVDMVAAAILAQYPPAAR